MLLKAKFWLEMISATAKKKDRAKTKSAGGAHAVKINRSVELAVMEYSQSCFPTMPCCLVCPQKQDLKQITFIGHEECYSYHILYTDT